MAAKYKLRKFFGNGAGQVFQYADSETLLFYWHGRGAGSARFVPHVRRYTRNEKEYASLASLLRAVEAENMASA